MPPKKEEEKGYTPRGTYLDAGLSEADRAIVGDLSRQWGEAQARGDQAGMDAAHKAAEAIRAGYGYSGGGDGSEYLTTPKGGQKTSIPADWIGGGSGSGAVGAWGGGQFSYASAPTYTSKYRGQIDALTQQILGRAAFEYDPEQDPAYRQYREQYTRAGKRAMEDTLGQVSARTGGLASSYAGWASQQAYNQYMEELADKVPELRQLAYQMYAAEGDRQRADLEMLKALEQGDYNKYLNLLGQYNTDRSMDYGIFRDQVGDGQWQQSFDRGVLEGDREYAYQMGRDAVSDRRYQQELEYQMGRDAISDQRYQQQMDYQRDRDAVSDRRYQQELDYQRDRDAISDQRYQQELDYQRGRDAASAAQQQRENDLAVAKLLASYGDFSGYAALGVDTSGMEAAWADQEEIKDVEIPKTDSAGDGDGQKASWQPVGSRAAEYDAMGPAAKRIADRILQFDPRKRPEKKFIAEMSQEILRLVNVGEIGEREMEVLAWMLGNNEE